MPYWYTDADETAVTDGKGRVIPCEPSNAEWAALVASEESILPPPPPVLMPAAITRWQCAVHMRAISLISDAEALAMIRTAAAPSFVETLFAALDPADQQRAREAFAASEYERGSEIVAMILPPGTTADEVDEFFRAAGQLKP